MKIKRLDIPKDVPGRPFLPGKLKNPPDCTPDEYIRNVILFKRTANDISGLKASWFQFQNFINVEWAHRFTAERALNAPG